jgi:molybdate-binding protein
MRRSEVHPEAPVETSRPAALVAANGDLVIECLLARLSGSGRAPFGHVQADRGEGLELLKQDDVLVAGCHGNEIPGALSDQRLVFIHLVDRQVGLALRRGVRRQSLRQIARWRLASRPKTAGVRGHFDEELRRQGLDPDSVHAGAVLLPSHREVVCTVARGEVDAGLASFAWAGRVGLDCVPLCRESYGLLVRASLLGDPRMVRLCEVVQSRAFRREVGSIPGYDARLTGTISFQSPQGTHHE